MVVGDVLARGAQRLLLESWSEHSEATALTYLFLCVFLVLFAGTMSGLTLGLMSMDIVELEVLRRSGSDVEQRQAARIIPVVKDAHFLLVTLLLCNAIAMEALPIFLDKIMGEVAAILASVTAVLFMGEILPQAVCSKHGLVIGSAMAIPVRLLMLLTSPISYPIAKLLDFVLGGEHASLFRRKQLKALVTLHARDEGFGGRLTADEIQIITGALDLTRKTAYHAMTPLDKVFMLSAEQKLDDATVSAVMASKPFSRLPVYRGNNHQDIIGVILVKELLEYVKHFPDSTVSSMKIRQLPRLSADTPMYDLLKLFRVGRSHMALLTQPEMEESDTTTIPETDGLDSMTWAYKHDHRLHHNPGGVNRYSDMPHIPRLATVQESSGHAVLNVSSGDDGSPKNASGTDTAAGTGAGAGAEHGKGGRTSHERHRTRVGVEAQMGNGTSGMGKGGYGKSEIVTSESETTLLGVGQPSSSTVNTPPQVQAVQGQGRSGGATPVKRSLISSIMSNIGLMSGSPSRLDVEEQQPMLGGGPGSAALDRSSPFQVLSSSALESLPSGGGSGTGGGGTGAHQDHTPLLSRLSHSSSAGPVGGSRHPAGIPLGPHRHHHASHGNLMAMEGGSSPGVRGTSAHEVDGALVSMGSATARSVSSLRSLFMRGEKKEGEVTGGGASMGDTGGGGGALEMTAPGQRSGKSGRRKGSRRRKRASQTATSNPEMPSMDGMDVGHLGKQSSSSSSTTTTSTDESGSSRDDLEDMLPVPLIAKPGEAIGIITIEDVIEELMGIEILDETDKFMDNEQSIPVNIKGLEEDLPDHLRSVLTVAERAKNQVLGPAIDRQSWLLQAAATAGGGVSSAQGSSTQASTSVLAGLAGSVFRHAFGSGPDAAAGTAGHGGQHGPQAGLRERHAGVSPVRGISPIRGRANSPPKRVTIESSGAGAGAGTGTGGAATGLPGGNGTALTMTKLGSARAAGGVPGSLPLPKGAHLGEGGNVQRSDIRAAAVMAAAGFAPTSSKKTMANWKLIESQTRGSGGHRHTGSHGGGWLLPGHGSSHVGGGPSPSEPGNAHQN